MSALDDHLLCSLLLCPKAATERVTEATEETQDLLTDKQLLELLQVPSLPSPPLYPLLGYVFL